MVYGAIDCKMANRPRPPRPRQPYNHPVQSFHNTPAHSQQRNVMPTAPAYHAPLVPAGSTQHPSFQPQPQSAPGQAGHVTASLSELTAKLRSNTYSGSAMMMIEILNHFFSVLILGGDRTALPPTDAMLQLLDDFVVNPHVVERGAGQGAGQGGVSALEVLRFVNNYRKFLEGPTDKGVKLCVFDAIFGNDANDVIDSSVTLKFQHHLLVKLLSLGVSCQSKNVLEVASFWMMRYPRHARFVMKDIYSSFCELLPDVSKPLEDIVQVVPPFSSQMSIAATHMFPIYSEDSLSEVQKPPLKLLCLVGQWIRSNPGVLFSLLGTHSSLPLRRGPPAPSTNAATLLPIDGVVRWAVLSPLLPRPQEGAGLVGSPPPPPPAATATAAQTSDANESVGGGARGRGNLPAAREKEEEEEQGVYSYLHTSLLQALLEHTSIKSSTSTYTYPVDITIFNNVASLLSAAIQQQWDTPTSRQGASPAVDLAVNRLAQILQVSLTHKLLPAPTMSDARTLLNLLPENRLTSLVLAPYLH